MSAPKGRVFLQCDDPRGIGCVVRSAEVPRLSIEPYLQPRGWVPRDMENTDGPWDCPVCQHLHTDIHGPVTDFDDDLLVETFIEVERWSARYYHEQAILIQSADDLRMVLKKEVKRRLRRAAQEIPAA